MQVQYLCYDNAGENVIFKRACKQEELGVNLEYKAPGMPQQNGFIEQKFATLFNQVCAMLNGEKFTTNLCNGLWAKAANTPMLLEIIF